MFSVITNIYNKKTKGPTLMEFECSSWYLSRIVLYVLYFIVFYCVHLLINIQGVS